MSKIFFISLLIFVSNLSFASNFIAEVIRVRGNVTQLAPNEKLARTVKIGDKFIEDTSILTSDKSFIKIKFIDNTELNVGPESKIVVSTMRKGEPGVISLLKGKIRTEVLKNSNPNENKFYIKTRTAAMGIRGTDFQTIYNPENKVTSLLTYRGEVAMAKLENKEYLKIEEASDATISVNRNNSNNDLTISKNNAVQFSESNELNKILKNKNTVFVPAGQNSVASDELKKATLPVKISPVQLNILYKNDDFKEKEADELKAATKNSKIESELVTVDQVAPVEGVKNSATGDFAPKAGGFIDLTTGLYVAPDKNAVFDPKQKIYVSEKIGQVDEETGVYMAPKGLKLDSKKGFISNLENENPELVAEKDELNKGALALDKIVKNVKLNDVKLTAESEKPVAPEYKIGDKFNHDEIELSTTFGKEELLINENMSNTPFYSLNADKDNVRLNFEWRVASQLRVRPIVGTEFANINFKKSMPSNFTMESRKLFNIYFGGMYSLTQNFDLISKLGLFQNHYLNQLSTTNNYNLERVVTTRFTLGIHSEFFKNRMFSFFLDGYGLVNLRKRLNSLKVKEGAGFGGLAGISYNFKNKNAMSVGLWTQNQTVKAAGELGENRLFRHDSGLKLSYIVNN
jgi:hypothetical protein